MRRQLERPLRSGPSLFIAYLFWLTAGFLGIHRFYLRSALGVIFIPVFLFILYCNAEVREVRDDTSRTFAALEQAQHEVDIAKPGDAAPSPEAAARYQRAQADVSKARGEYDVAKGVTDAWLSRSRWGAIVLALLLLVDAVLLPGLVRKQTQREAAAPHRPFADATPARPVRRP